MPPRVLAVTRGHWRSETGCPVLLDWTWDEARGTLHWYGPEPALGGPSLANLPSSC